MHARSALFDLYGDHLRRRGGSAPVSALVRLLAPLDIAPPAVRTAVSRMVRQGWLAPVRLEAGPGYALTERAHRRLDDAAARIYHTRERWDGRWDLLVLPPVPNRSSRARIRSGLSFLGYAPLEDGTWLGPYRSPEVEPLLRAEGVESARFRAEDDDSVTRAARLWDLEALGDAYAEWEREARRLVSDPRSVLGERIEVADADEEAFAVRCHLVHEWRKFLFTDPGLPDELLPDGWPGHEANAVFTREASRLLPAATRFVDRCLEQSGENR